MSTKKQVPCICAHAHTNKSLLKDLFIYFMYMSTHCSCTDSCEPSSGCWELNLGPRLTPAQRFIYYYTYVRCFCLQTHQKRASDLIMGGGEPPCSCRNLNSGPIGGQSVLLPTEPLRQPSLLFLKQGPVLSSRHA